MATNEVFRNADHLSLPVPDGTKAGDPVVVGSLVGVAQTDRDDAGKAAVWLKGAYELEVTGAITNVGDEVYIVGDGTRQTGVNTTDTNTKFGTALATKTAAAGVIPVRVAQV